MKIFFPLEVFYPSQAGGPANTIYWIVKNLTRNGFEPIIIATDKGLPSEIPRNKWIENEAGRVIFIKTRFLHFPIYQALISLYHFFQADVVHLSSIFFPTAFLVGFAARLFKKPIIWSTRGELDPLALNHSKNRKRPILWLIKKIIGTYPTFHSTCLEETDFIKLVFGSKARVELIPNFIETPSLVERKPSKYLLYIGRIHPKKAIDNLIRAVMLSKSFSEKGFILKIAGKGKPEHQDILLKLVNELNLHSQIEFLGQIEKELKQQILADAFFTIMPSHTENFGIVVLESLAQNTPVVASKGSPWARLELEKIGFWTDNSPETLAEYLEKILTMSDTEYSEYRRRARSFVLENFDIKNNIGKWEDFYQKLK